MNIPPWDKKAYAVERVMSDLAVSKAFIAIVLIRGRRYLSSMLKDGLLTVDEIVDYLRWPEGHPNREKARYVRGIDLKQYAMADSA